MPDDVTKPASQPARPLPAEVAEVLKPFAEAAGELLCEHDEGLVAYFNALRVKHLRAAARLYALLTAQPAQEPKPVPQGEVSKYDIAQEWHDGIAAKLLGKGRDGTSPHWLAGWDAAYGLRKTTHELLNCYLISVGAEPMGVVRLQTSQPAPHPATHRCKVCGARWRLNPAQPNEYPADHPFYNETWTLVSPRCGGCCDNEPMGDQIEKIDATAQPMPYFWAKFLTDDDRAELAKLPEDLVSRIMAAHPRTPDATAQPDDGNVSEPMHRGFCDQCEQPTPNKGDGSSGIILCDKCQGRKQPSPAPHPAHPAEEVPRG